MMESENKNLTGGQQNMVTKIGETVHRMAKGHPMLHAYLLYIEEAGMINVPRFLGLDELGREILTYLPGKTMGRDFSYLHPCLYSDDTITDAARFMRRLHDVSAGFVQTAIENGWKNPYFPDSVPETICHGDAAIWNFVFVNDRFTGMFDFDQAHPGSRLWDIASMMFSMIPLTYFGYNPDLRDAAPYDPMKHAENRKRRIDLFFDAYGIDCPENIIDIVAQRIQKGFCDGLTNGAAAGDENCIRMIAQGHLAHYQKVVAHLKEYAKEWASCTPH